MSRNSRPLPNTTHLTSDHDLALMLIGERSTIIDRLEKIDRHLDLLGISTPLADAYAKQFHTAKKPRKLSQNTSFGKTDPRQLHLLLVQD